MTYLRHTQKSARSYSQTTHSRTLGVLEVVVLGKDLAGQIQHRQRAGNADSSTRSDDSQVPTTDCG